MQVSSDSIHSTANAASELRRNSRAIPEREIAFDRGVAHELSRKPKVA